MKNVFWGLEKIDIVKKASFSEIDPAKGKNKIYTVTSVDKDGLESELGEEVTVLYLWYGGIVNGRLESVAQ